MGYSVSVFCVVYVLVTTVSATAVSAKTVSATTVSANDHLPCDEGYEGPCRCQNVVTTQKFPNGVTETFTEVTCDAKKNKRTNEAMKSRGKKSVRTRTRSV